VTRPAKALWDIAALLNEELPAVDKEVEQMWEEFAGFLEKGALNAPYPGAQARYALALVEHQQLMARTIALRPVIPNLFSRTTQLELPQKLAVLTRYDPTETLRRLLTCPEAQLRTFKPDSEALIASGEEFDVTAASTCIAAMSPWRYHRDTMAAYLGRQPKTAPFYAAAAAILQQVAVDFVSKGNPLIGLVLTVAEAVTKNNRKRAEEADAEFRGVARLEQLDDDLRATAAHLDSVETVLRESAQRLHVAEQQFTTSHGRLSALLT
jgi:hypothetical protein